MPSRPPILGGPGRGWGRGGGGRRAFPATVTRTGDQGLGRESNHTAREIHGNVVDIFPSLH